MKVFANDNRKIACRKFIHLTHRGFAKSEAFLENLIKFPVIPISVILFYFHRSRDGEPYREESS